MTPAGAYLAAVDRVIQEVVEPAAAQVDASGSFPRAGIQALGQSGLLGLVSATEVGGQGEGLRAAALVVERLAQACASTAMVVCMHYAASALIEAHGPHAVREQIASGRHLSTLAFSETGSRSHFWAPLSTASIEGGHAILNASKSWVTSAGEADSYVWSSRPVNAEGASTLWLAPANTPGLEVSGPFDGLGLRGNSSRPVKATNAAIPAANRLGEDGKGFDLMMGVVLPYFQLMSAAVSIGIMESATTKAATHLGQVRYEHLDQTAADMPTNRAYIARARIKTDLARALLRDTLNAAETGAPETMLRVLEVKAAAGEAATEVTDLAMRVAGGAGFRKELGVERHFRDARAATVMAPTTDTLYDFIGRIVVGLPLF
ncbi:MAG TPA: acyl-CoA dehydrogenase family protein [Chloroflexota bacterium]|nr:acyl-CoA dehydrogenase family protein [Chloroflexota bacterium]